MSLVLSSRPTEAERSEPPVFAPWPSFSEEETDAAAATLRSGKVNYWTGTEGREFEREFAAFAGTSRAVAVFNGSVAIELALEALGLKCGDEIVVTPRTFIASASSCAIRGIKPVFADVDRDSGNVTPETVARALTPRTKAILAVHLAGWPCDVHGLLDIAHVHDLKLIEDCAQAHGATVGGRSVGSFGHANAWSFCQDKIMTTGGEGGMMTTNTEEAWSRAWSYKDHGKSWEAVYEREHAPGFRWLHESLGTNWRMTEFQSAIGRVQLGKMPAWTDARESHARTLIAHLEDLDAVRVPTPDPDVRHAYYKFYLYVRPEALKSGWSRDRIMAEVGARGVPLLSGSCSEIYLEKAWDGTGLRPAERLPVARELGETSLMTLVHPTLSNEAASYAGETIRAVVREATR